MMTISYKMRQILLQNATVTLLQNAAEVHCKIHQVFITKCKGFITKCDSYYKFRQFYCKMRQLLQSVTLITNCDSTIIDTIYCFLSAVNSSET